MKQDYRVNINKQNWMEEIQTNYNNVEFLNYPQQKESN